MNNKRSGKPFSGKKGAPVKKSGSKDSGKSPIQRKTNSQKTSGNFSPKNNSGKTFSKGKTSDNSFSERRKKRGEEKPFRTKKSDEKDSAKPGDRRKFTDKGKFSSKPDRKSFQKKSGNGFDKKDKLSDRKKTNRSENKLPRFTEKNYSDKKESQPTYNIKTPKRVKKESEPSDGKIRLNKFIANSGVCSRRDADGLISLGEVTVNGQIVTELGFKVTKDDVVTLHGRKLTPEKLVYVLLNKPKDFITTTDDPQERKTVMALVQNACKERIFPVGRLDRNTTGLLLFTNDGDLAEKLTHPRKKIKKLYQADLDKPITKDDFEKILKGLRLEDGLVQVDDLAIVSADKKSIGIEIHEGRNRIVRRIFESLGYDVIRLDRVMYAGLTKRDLPRGNWRYLTEKEVIRLKHF